MVMRIKRKKIYGVGINNLDGAVYGNAEVQKCYGTWVGILERCYCSRFHKSHPTYTGCTISDEWVYFTNFLFWYQCHYIEGYSLDKDILIKGNKKYGADTCCFVPYQINMLFVKGDAMRGAHVLGVTYHKRSNVYQAQISINARYQYLGSYTTELRAWRAYYHAKMGYIKDMANQFRDKIDKKVYRAMMRYRVEKSD